MSQNRVQRTNLWSPQSRRGFRLLGKRLRLGVLTGKNVSKISLKTR